MALSSRHLAIEIERDATSVYLYASEPSNLPEWAAGLGGSIEFSHGKWIAAGPSGKMIVDFVDANKFGVLDHWVTLESGERFYNPMRVIPNGENCEVVFTLRPQPGMTSDEFDADAEAIRTDLETLKRVVEEG